MSVWAQIEDEIITTIPPDGRTIVDIYAEFTFGDETVPDGTRIGFVVGKGSELEGEFTVDSLKQAITPVDGVELFDDIGIVEEKFVRDSQGNLSLRHVARVRLKPINEPLKDNILVAAYSTYDKLGTADRFAHGSVSLTVSSGEGVFLGSVERYDILADTWDTVASIPKGRSGMFCGNVGGKVYAIGGFDGNFVGLCDEYDPATDVWTSKTEMVIARGFGATVVIGGDMYVIGGYNFSPGRAVANVDKYNPGTDTWTSLEPIPFPVAFGMATPVGTDIYLFYGGTAFDEEDKVTDSNLGILKYNTVTDEWNLVDTIYPSPPATQNTSAAAAAGEFFIEIPAASGFYKVGFLTIDRGLVTEETLYYSTFIDGTVTFNSPMEFAHAAGATVNQASTNKMRLAGNCYNDGSDIVVFNGYSGSSTSGKPLITVESFDISTETVSLSSAVPIIPRYNAGQGSVGTDTYIVGGSAEKSDFLDEIETVDSGVGTFVNALDEMSLARTFMGVASGNDGVKDYIFAIGGQGNGHEAGWLKMEVQTSPEKIRADGRETATVTVTATDSSGDPPANGTKFKVRGLLFIPQQKVKEAKAEAVTSDTGAATDERTPVETISILPVLFSSKEMTMTSGECATVLLDRSEDMVNEVQNLLDFAKKNEKVPDERGLREIAKNFENSEILIGEQRELYSIAIEVIVDDPFYFGQTDTDSAVANVDDTSLSSGAFSFNPPSSKQGGSGSVSFYSDIASLPDVQMVTSSPVEAADIPDIVDAIAEEIPFGASPHYDALVLAARSRIPTVPVPAAVTNLIISASDNENSGSASSAADVAEEVNLVNGVGKFPVFVTTFVVTDPLSLAARRERTDVEDLELISSETGGQSFSVDKPEYVSFVIDRIKTSAPASIGSGSITVQHEIEGSFSVINFVAENMITGNSAELTVEYSEDGYNFVSADMLLKAGNAASPSTEVSSTFTFGTPIKAKIVRYTVKLASKSFDSPILNSVTIQYIKPSVQYVFTPQQTINGQVSELAVVTNERVPSGCTIEAGVVHGDSLEFDRDFVTRNQPGVQVRGSIMAINRNFQTIIDGTVFRDTMETGDFLIYKAKSGPWAQDAITKVAVNEIEALPDEFIAVPEEGKVVFRRKLAEKDKVVLEVQNPSTFRVGLKIVNPTLSEGVVDSFAFMYGETDKSDTLKPNRPPRALNLFITPSPVVPGGPIEANFTFSDPDGDEEDKDQTQVTWYRNGVPVPELSNLRSFSNQDLIARRKDGGRDAVISRGQEWFFTVRPSDGKAFGPIATSHSVIVSNVPPTGTDALLVSSNKEDPSVFTTKDSITVDFKFVDNDGDTALNNVFTWFVNGIQVKTGTENMLSPDEEDDSGNKFIKAGVTVFAEIIPSDGHDFGPTVTSDTITVQSSAPTLSDVSILPTTPSPASSLRLTYKFVDIDGDKDQSKFAWFRNDVRQSNFDNLPSVPAGNLRPGEKWYAVVTPNDGALDGEPVKSNVVIVQF